MHWLKKKDAEWRHEEQANKEDVSRVFAENFDSLYILGLLITGDPSLARTSIAEACSLCQQRTGVFREWLTRWAQTSTARQAVHCIHDEIARCADRYDQHSCDHVDHPLIDRDLVAALDPKELTSCLDPLARSVLVLRTLIRASVTECAGELKLPRKIIRAAYCVAIAHLGQQPETEQDDRSDCDSAFGVLVAESASRV